MTTKKVIVAIALFFSATSAALAQSAYTAGTTASSTASGYPTLTAEVSSKGQAYAGSSFDPAGNNLALE
jgi:hypothetical protein